MLRAGIDLGGTKIQTVVVDENHKVIGQDRRPTPTTGTPDGVADQMAESVRAAMRDAGAEFSLLVGAGIGAPGQVDPSAGTVSNAGNLPGWMLTYPLTTEMSKRLGGVPVFVANDVQVAVKAELRLGAGRPYTSMLGVFCGTGVGGGVVINDEMWLGRGAAGEIGHLCIQAQGGAPCTCGRSGCMEAYAGRAAMEIQARKWVKKGHKTSLFKIMKKKGKPRLASGVWYSALKHKDKMATKLVKRAIWALGAGVGSAVNLTDVEAVVIGGGLGIRLGQPFVDKVEAAMQPHLIKPQSPPKVLLAELGDLGGAIGASLLVSDSLPATRTPAKRAPARKAPAAKKAPASKAPAAKKGPATKAPARRSPARTSATAKKAAAPAAARKAPAGRQPAKKATASTDSPTT